MKSGEAPAVSAAQPWPVVLPGVFFAWFFISYGRVVDPALHFQSLQPVFLLDKSYAGEILRFPGGPIEYLASFLMQFYPLGWLGAGLSTLVLVALTQVLKCLLRRIGPTDLTAFAWAPAAVLWAFSSQYGFPWLEASLSLLFVALAVFAYIALSLERWFLRVLVFLALNLLLFYLAGAHCLIFLLSSVCYELAVRRQIFVSLGILGLGAVVPGLGAWFFALHRRDGYLLKLPFATPQEVWSFPLVLYVLIPLAVLVAGLATWWRHKEIPPSHAPSALNVKTEAEPTRKPKGKPKHPSSGDPRGPRHSTSAPRSAMRSGLAARCWTALRNTNLHPIALGLLGFIVAVTTLNGNEKRLLQLDRYALQRNWKEVLNCGRQLDAYTRAAISDINRALCHTGRLPYEMFAFPQRRNYDLWLWMHEGMHPHNCQKASELLFELGQINLAERMAAEALEISGYRPETLHRLAMIEVLKDRPQAARLFLNTLRKTVLHRGQADRLLAKLDEDPKLSTYEEVARARSFMVTTDYFGSSTTEPILQQLLHQNRLNRMAFDYLMVHYLLTMQLGKIYVNLNRPGFSPYPEIPRHLEEALLLYAKSTGQPLSLRENRISPQTEEHFRQFQARLNDYRGDQNAARVGLAKDFGDTYWYFAMFGYSSKALTQADLNTDLSRQP